MPEPLRPQAVHEQIVPAPHGGHPGLTISGLDFSANSNPYGPNPLLLEAARTADVSTYPDAQHQPTRQRLADWHGLEATGLTLGVGASELLYRLARTYLKPGANVLSLGPAFGEFGRACQLARAELMEVELAQAELDGSEAVLEALRPTLVYLCRPHNPLGVSLPLTEVQALAERCQATGALLILDEAYLPLAPEVGTVVHPSVVRLRSPGKAHGVVGLRLAYALSSQAVGDALRNLAPAWALPSPTLAALEALPDAQGWLDKTLPLWQSGAAELAASIATLTEVRRTGLPFFLARTLPGVLDALSARGLHLRDCASYGLSGWARISARRAEDNAALSAALGELL